VNGSKKKIIDQSLEEGKPYEANGGDIKKFELGAVPVRRV
jgi:hypothetical protein